MLKPLRLYISKPLPDVQGYELFSATRWFPGIKLPQLISTSLTQANG